MSHTTDIIACMKSRISRPLTRLVPSVELRWTHCGVQFRATRWPEVRFEREAADGNWVAIVPNEEICSSAAVSLSSASWRRYLAEMPDEERRFLEQFRFGRLDALEVISQCPELLPVLKETPALTSFIACHAHLRGTPGPRWGEINAIFERDGVFGLLDWLGLPSSRTTLEVLENIVDPDIPRRLLEPLRTGLWQPATIYALRQAPVVNDRQLNRHIHIMAA